MKQKLVELKGEIGKSIIIDGDFNIFLSRIDRTTRQKVSKDIEEPHNTISQPDCNRYVDIYRTRHPTRAEYTIFSSAHRTYIKVDHILCHKTKLKELKSQSVFSDQKESNEKSITER